MREHGGPHPKNHGLVREEAARDGAPGAARRGGASGASARSRAAAARRIPPRPGGRLFHSRVEVFPRRVRFADGRGSSSGIGSNPAASRAVRSDTSPPRSTASAAASAPRWCTGPVFAAARSSPRRGAGGRAAQVLALGVAYRISRRVERLVVAVHHDQLAARVARFRRRSSMYSMAIVRRGRRSLCTATVDPPPPPALVHSRRAARALPRSPWRSPIATKRATAGTTPGRDACAAAGETPRGGGGRGRASAPGAGRGRVDGRAPGVQGVHERVDERRPHRRQGRAPRIRVQRPAPPGAHREEARPSSSRRAARSADRVVRSVRRRKSSILRARSKSTSHAGATNIFLIARVAGEPRAVVSTLVDRAAPHGGSASASGGPRVRSRVHLALLVRAFRASPASRLLSPRLGEGGPRGSPGGGGASPPRGLVRPPPCPRCAISWARAGARARRPTSARGRRTRWPLADAVLGDRKGKHPEMAAPRRRRRPRRGVRGPVPLAQRSASLSAAAATSPPTPGSPPSRATRPGLAPGPPRRRRRRRVHAVPRGTKTKPPAAGPPPRGVRAAPGPPPRLRAPGGSRGAALGGGGRARDGTAAQPGAHRPYPSPTERR